MLILLKTSPTASDSSPTSSPAYLPIHPFPLNTSPTPQCRPHIPPFLHSLPNIFLFDSAPSPEGAWWRGGTSGSPARCYLSSAVTLRRASLPNLCGKGGKREGGIGRGVLGYERRERKREEGSENEVSLPFIPPKNPLSL
jgi:hypothetical protein